MSISKTFVIILIVFFILSVLLNGATLVAILASRRLRKVPHIFTFSVALADFASTIFSTLQILQQARQVMLFLMGAAMMTSICSSLAVAFHRLIIIRLSPFNCTRIVTASRCIAVSASIWVVVFGVFLVVKYSINDPNFLFFNLIQPIIYLAVITVCGLCYVIIYVTLNRSARELRLSTDAHLHRIAQNKRVLFTFALIVGSNMACWSLYCAWLLIVYCAPSLVFADLVKPVTLTLWAEIFSSIAFLLVNVNAVVNPLIYWTRLSDFRRLMVSCFDGLRRSPSTSSSQSTETQVETRSRGKETLALSDLRAMNGSQNDGYKVEA